MGERLKRKAKLLYVPIEKMCAREGISQRTFRPHWARQILSEFNLEDLGCLTVNHVGEWYWVTDGQHRLWALKKWLGEYAGQTIQCWVYDDLSEKEEAELFDRLNTIKAVSAFDRFKVRLTAEREEETNINAVVRLKKLKVSRQKGEGAISCVGTLAKVYRLGPDFLSRDLDITYQSFGDSGLDADILNGLGVLVSRYDGRLDDKRAIRALESLRGGVNAIRNRAETLRQQTGASRSHCIAAAALETYNRSKGGKKLPSWWKSEAAT